MQNFILGAAVFFFAASIALNIYSYSLLNRAIHILRFSMNLMERVLSETHDEFYRKEGSI